MTSSLENDIKIIKGFKNSHQIGSSDDSLETIYLNQAKILENHNHRFILNNDLMDLMKYSEYTLGDFSDCVTGIYTGDNKRFMAVSRLNVRNGKNYPIADNLEIDYNHKSLLPLNNDKKYIPIVKSSPLNKFYRNDNPWLIEWTYDAINYYKINKKARFQNSQFYFKHGIAVPMVKSKIVKATEMNNAVFDQSIVGVFPKSEKYFYYILGLLNSDIGNKIIHLINPTANNSANYLKKIPFIIPDKTQLNEIDIIVKKLKEDSNNLQYMTSLNDLFEDIYLNYTPSKIDLLF